MVWRVSLWMIQEGSLQCSRKELREMMIPEAPNGNIHAMQANVLCCSKAHLNTDITYAQGHFNIKETIHRPTDSTPPSPSTMGEASPPSFP